MFGPCVEVVGGDGAFDGSFSPCAVFAVGAGGFVDGAPCGGAVVGFEVGDDFLFDPAVFVAQLALGYE